MYATQLACEELHPTMLFGLAVIRAVLAWAAGAGDERF
jgi:hypothetical protein